MMKAIVLATSGDPTALQIQEIAKPLPRSRWVLTLFYYSYKSIINVLS